MAPGEDVHMEVPDALTHRAAAVDHDPEATGVASIGGDLSHDLQHPPAHALVHELAKTGDVLPRDHKSVKRRLRRAVLEGDDVEILVEEPGADLPARDLAEHTIGHAARIPRWS